MKLWLSGIKQTLVSANWMNDNLDKQQQLMVITMEECAELQVACSKILRQGTKVTEEKLKELTEELGDVYCMIQLMHEHGFVESKDLNERVQVKKQKLEKWSDLVGR